MVKNAVVDSLGEHMDSLKVTIGWALLVAFVFGSGALGNDNKVQFLGLKLEREIAFYVVAVFYSFVNLKVLILLIKIKSLIHNLKNNDFIEGLSKVALHSFIANPFGYFLKGKITWINSAGPGLLIVAWWVANSSLYIVIKDAEVHQPTFYFIVFLFAAIGIFTLFAMSGLDKLTMEVLKCVDSEFHADLVAKKTRRSCLTFGGIFVGFSIGLLAFLTRYFDMPSG